VVSFLVAEDINQGSNPILKKKKKEENRVQILVAAGKPPSITT